LELVVRGKVIQRSARSY